MLLKTLSSKVKFLILHDRSIFYGDYCYFVNLNLSWTAHGGQWMNDFIAGSFSFGYTPGDNYSNDGSRFE